MTSATRNSLELIVRCAASAATGLIWSRMRLRSVTKRIMPPRSANRSTSLTLRRSSRGPTDEEDVAPRDVVHALIAMDREGPGSASLPAHGGVEEVAERVAPENPDDQRRLRVRNGLGGPIDELREVEQEHSLHLDLGGPRPLRPEAGGPNQRYAQRR